MDREPRADRRRRAATGKRGPAAIGRMIVVAATSAGLVSCNILGPATYFAFGQSKAEAKYVLLDRRTVVFVDDRHNAIPLNATRIRRTIADKVSMDLMAQEVLTATISSRDAMALARRRDREGKLLSMETIGESVGAQQVIYVEMMGFRGSPDGVTPRPSASCRVKVIDVANRTRLFPAPDAHQAWQDVSVESLPISLELYRTAAGRREIEEMLAKLLGDQVAKLFYGHVPREIGTRLRSR